MYGPEVVNAAGLAALGYPAVLASADYEVRAIKEKLPSKPS
jgi:hypothetical protein